MNKEQTYIAQTLQLFLEKGIKNVTMSEIARALNASSKTIYKIFEDKTGLVLACIRLHQQQMSTMEQQIMEQKGEQVIEAMITIHDAFLAEMAKVDLVYFNDIAHYYPDIWASESYFDFRYTKRLMIKGIKEGIFYKNIDVELAVDTIVLLMKAMIEHNDFQSEYQANHELLYSSILLPYLRGICTMNGLQKLKEYHRQQSETSH
ncbi:hypothetical protein BKI52_05910 [marine bacterium AO1-C]|nr:hypothetical protein BKI52_05910 [marine bacterium AO1-C]